MNKQQWEGYIKDYDGGTLMQCQLEALVPYTDFAAVIARQKQVGPRPWHAEPGSLL